MKKMILLFSHRLTDEQISDAEKMHGIANFLYLPEDLQKIWSGVDPVGELPVDRLDLVIDWIKAEAEPGDYVLIQGDFGSVFYLVEYCLSTRLIPLYSTTKRESIEVAEEGGVVKKTLSFRHVNFRKYKRYKG